MLVKPEIASLRIQDGGICTALLSNKEREKCNYIKIAKTNLTKRKQPLQKSTTLAHDQECGIQKTN